MSPSALSTARLLALLVTLVHAQTPSSTYPATPLASKHFASPSDLPYKVDSDTNLVRGPQFGYNICNATTQNQDSLCQNAYVNNIADFCLWSPAQPNSTVGEKEGDMVAWCTSKAWGTRLIPNNALQAVQWIKTPDYALVSGYIDQSKINLEVFPDMDYGGEMDNFGADGRGNPMGGTVWSNAFSPDNKTLVQITYWNNFMGGNAFCFKVCDPSRPNGARYCEHVFDRIGCAYNDPTNVQNGTFTSCLGENQDFPGIYVSGGQTITYQQPDEKNGAITSMPYTARIPATSSCTSYESTKLYTDLLTVTAPGDKPTSTGSASGKGSASGSSNGPKQTGSSSDATSIAVGGVATILGVLFSALFLV